MLLFLGKVYQVAKNVFELINAIRLVYVLLGALIKLFS